MPLHKMKITKILKLTQATIASLTWNNGEPAYVTSLTANTVLPAPTNMTEGESMAINLQGNTGGFVWDLSAYKFGQNNSDASAFVPNQSILTTLQDRISVRKVGPGTNDLEAVWQRGCPHVVPT